MPLVWAHAEYIKLLRSLRDGRVFDMPPHGVQRYLIEQRASPHHVWRFNHKCRWLPVGQRLRIEVRAPAVVRWTSDAARTWTETPTTDTQLGIHYADLPTVDVLVGSTITFSFFWPETNHWEGNDFVVKVV